MAKLIYGAICSLDGYVADREGRFDWAEPDEELHTFINDLERPVGTYLYGRRMYEVMVAWETMGEEGSPTFIRDFADIWRAAEKIVYSKSLESPSSARTRIVRDFDPAAVRRLKDPAESDLSIGGPELASHALRSGLVDECYFLVAPVIVGGGNRALPGNVRADLELVEERRFTGGVVYLRYAVVH
jgi:dihydrofolate reductase